MINNFHSDEKVPESWARKETKANYVKEHFFHHSPMPHIVMLCGQKANFSSSFHFDFSISLMSGIEKSENFLPREKFVLISFLCMICSMFFSPSLSFLSRQWFSTRKLPLFFAVRTSHHLVIIFSCSTTWCTSISDWYYVLLTPLSPFIYLWDAKSIKMSFLIFLQLIWAF